MIMCVFVYVSVLTAQGDVTPILRLRCAPISRYTSKSVSLCLLAVKMVMFYQWTDVGRGLIRVQSMAVLSFLIICKQVVRTNSPGMFQHYVAAVLGAGKGE